MYKFGSVTSCVKCEAYRSHATLRFHFAHEPREWETDDDNFVEHMHVACSICGFAWVETPADYQPPPPEPPPDDGEPPAPMTYEDLMLQ